MGKDLYSMTAMPKVSVIIPVYNAERWLADALDSVRAQTFMDFEVIMVNDGSTDGSEAVCRRYCDADSRFSLITQSNSGVSHARNVGIDMAKGEWIAFLDADDLLLPDSLQIQWEAAKRFGVKVVTGEFSRDVNFTAIPTADNAESVSADEAILIGLYQKKILNSPCGQLFHKTVFINAPQLRFSNCKYEDLDIFYRIFERAGKICILNSVVYLYRDNPDSFINNWSDARLDALDVTDRILEHMTARGDKRLIRAARDRRFSAHCNILLLMLRNHIDNPSQKRRCIRVIREERLRELTDPHVRLKNKAGALLSYFSFPIFRFL